MVRSRPALDERVLLVGRDHAGKKETPLMLCEMSLMPLCRLVSVTLTMSLAEVVKVAWA